MATTGSWSETLDMVAFPLETLMVREQSCTMSQYSPSGNELTSNSTLLRVPIAKKPQFPRPNPRLPSFTCQLTTGSPTHLLVNYKQVCAKMNTSFFEALLEPCWRRISIDAHTPNRSHIHLQSLGFQTEVRRLGRRRSTRTWRAWTRSRAPTRSPQPTCSCSRPCRSMHFRIVGCHGCRRKPARERHPSDPFKDYLFHELDLS